MYQCISVFRNPKNRLENRVENINYGCPVISVYGFRRQLFDTDMQIYEHCRRTCAIVVLNAKTLVMALEPHLYKLQSLTYFYCRFGKLEHMV
jgi:hypothetical protein